ncbi:tropomyosin (plasmid) [Streptomyces sp. NBC_01725]|uniref:hypothetical protein n=1 Tax=Streptomyces sp. NBC_01725 TaxID=2975923 RepID=UPI002E281334|nr:hypothetical protein [Streptomyces sp. NBC_01725]
MGGPKANELATYLAGLGARMGLRTTASFAEHFPGSSTLWAEYLNGSKIVPAHTLGLVVRKLYGADERKMQQTLTHAKQLHREAENEAARPAGGGEAQVAARELIAVQQHLVETTEKLAKANEVAERTRSVIPTLLAMYARVESSVRELTTQRNNSHALKRAETEARLDKARLRLERTEKELERARQHRYTAEQAQRALLIEAEEARRELEELRRKAADLNLGDTDSPEQHRLPAQQEIDPGDDDDFADYDDALERITSEGEERERDLADITEHTGTPMPEPQARGPQIITGTIIPTPRDPAHPDNGEDRSNGPSEADPDDPQPTPDADNTKNAATSGTDYPAPGPSTWHNNWPTNWKNPDPVYSQFTRPDSTPYTAPDDALYTAPDDALYTALGTPYTTPDDALAALLRYADAPYTAPEGTLGTPYDAPSSTPYGTPEGIPYGIPDATLYGIPDATPYGIPDATPYGIPDATPYGIPDATPYTAGELSGTTAEKASTSENTHALAPAEEALPAFWGWFLIPPVPVLAYTIPATFIAGIQASPGAGILNLIAYTILALPVSAVAFLFLLGPLTSIDSDIPFNSALALAILALLVGLVVPWTVGTDQPWHWIADRLGVI